MSTTQDKRFHWWWSWNFRQEEEWLDRLSMKGLHLQSTKLGLWHNFTKDNNTHYVYRLDYQPSLRKKAELQEYLNFYNDLGWQHVDATTGWHFFRKLRTEEEPLELYTDRESLKQHYKRIQWLIQIVTAIEILLVVTEVLDVTLLLQQQARSAAWGIAGPMFVVFIGIFSLLVYAYTAVRRKIAQI